MKRALSLVVLALVLAACAPAASVLRAPSIELQSFALSRVEPGAVGGGEAVFTAELRLSNPNPFSARIAGLDLGLFLDGARVAGSAFRGGIELPANGSAPLTVEIQTPFEGVPQLAAGLSRLLAGGSVGYRIDATPSVEVLGTTQRLPTVTIGSGDLRVPGGLALPEIRFNAAASSLSVRGLGLRADLVFDLHNPTIVGYLVSAPAVAVRIDGTDVGSVALEPLKLPAGGSAQARLSFEAGVAQLGALAGKLQGASLGSLQLDAAGEIVFEVPGVIRRSAGI